MKRGAKRGVLPMTKHSTMGRRRIEWALQCLRNAVSKGNHPYMARFYLSRAIVHLGRAILALDKFDRATRHPVVTEGQKRA